MSKITVKAADLQVGDRIVMKDRWNEWLSGPIVRVAPSTKAAGKTSVTTQAEGKRPVPRMYLDDTEIEVEREAPEIVYGVERWEHGKKRWALTRNGKIIRLCRKQSEAQRRADANADYLEVMGKESGLVKVDAAFVEHEMRWALEAEGVEA